MTFVKLNFLGGEPSSNNIYVFEGDYVDRGERGVEVVMLLAYLKQMYPFSVCLLKGNHETLRVHRDLDPPPVWLHVFPCRNKGKVQG